MSEFRTGLGYDKHPLVPGNQLVLGGISIDYFKSLAGHSDGDVLLHALVDALLGGAALGDIGTFFPDTDPRWGGIASQFFLEEAVHKLKAKKFEIVFIDGIILAEKPKLAPYFPRMKEKIAEIARISLDRISIKAKTGEKMDSVGQENAMASFVAATLRLD